LKYIHKTFASKPKRIYINREKKPVFKKLGGKIHVKDGNENREGCQVKLG
jgi:hypothetical protein